MEHTVESYLERLPTEKLAQFIEDYRRGKITENYDKMLPYMEAALEKRKIHAAADQA